MKPCCLSAIYNYFSLYLEFKWNENVNYIFPLCSKILQLEEEYIEKICKEIIAFKPDLVITEKGVSDLAQHYLAKANISAIRRVRKSDNNRIARFVATV